jgi:pimeloyl-ACP methyl ester carboxylesterase
VTQRLPQLGPVRHVRTDTLDVGYIEEGPPDGAVVLLLHGYPYDVHSYVDVIPLLVEAGRRVLVPYLRGHRPTRFLSDVEPRSGQQAALGTDVVELMDALHIRRAVLAGHDWGGRAGCVAAALWPDRCAGLVSVNGYLIQDISAANTPLRPDLEAGFWYFYYFLTERGRAGLTANRRDIAKVLWTRNSPDWQFDDATLDRAAAAFDNPDYVDVVLHSYRLRLGAAPGAGMYERVEKELATQPVISVPAVTLDGTADGNFPRHRRHSVRPPLHRTPQPHHAPNHTAPQERATMTADQQTTTAPPVDELAGKLKRTEIQHRPSSIPGREIVQVLTEILAGVESGWHTHPGEEVGYIVAGTVTMMIRDQPTLTLHAGDGFLIPPRIPHNARDIGPETGRRLSTYIVEVGQWPASPGELAQRRRADARPSKGAGHPYVEMKLRPTSRGPWPNAARRWEVAWEMAARVA